MQYQLSDVIITAPEYGSRTFIIISINDNKYYAISMKDKKRYWLEEEQILKKVGTNSPLLILEADPVQGVSYAIQQAGVATDNAIKLRWFYLASLKSGDQVEVVHRKFIHPAEFVQINVNKPVKAFRAKIKGKAHDFSLVSLITPLT